MKYVITGAAGNISKPLALQLLKSGHEVRVIGRNAENLQELIGAGAKALTGSVEDAGFLKKAFSGADAVYTMVPPNWNPTEWKKWIGRIGSHFADAVKTNGVKYVVNLSSVGAELPDGCGPVSGLYLAEQALNQSGAHVLHLRPSYFFNNLLANAGLAKHQGIIGSNFGGADFKLGLTSPEDIAAVAAEALLHLNFTGVSVRYIWSDYRTTDEIARVLGTAIGKPELPWIRFSNEQSEQGMLQAGLSPEVVKNYVEMGDALASGKMQAGLLSSQPGFGKVKLEDFARVFAAVYAAS